MSGICVRDLGIRLGGHWVLKSVNLEVESGSFCVITGPSGSGKSTFIRMLLSQLRPTEGSILLDGVAIASYPTADRGVVFQTYSVFPHMTAIENILIGLRFRSSPWSGFVFGRARETLRNQAQRALVEVGLENAALKYPHQLSGGMCQRLAIAQAMVARPKLLLLDEPFGALDAANRAQLHRVVLKLWRDTGATVVMVTHDQTEAQALATKLVRFEPCRHSGYTRVEEQSSAGVSVGTAAPRALMPQKRASKQKKSRSKSRNRRRSR